MRILKWPSASAVLGNVPREGLGDVTSEGVGTERACARAHTQVTPHCWSSPLLPMPPALMDWTRKLQLPPSQGCVRLSGFSSATSSLVPPKPPSAPTAGPAPAGPRVQKELRLFPALLGRLISQLLGKALSSTSLNKSLLLQTDSYFSPSVQRCLLK